MPCSARERTCTRPCTPASPLTLAVVLDATTHTVSLLRFMTSRPSVGVSAHLRP
jgi:hypothetical protein